MAYTPELNQEDSSTLRRIAWALNLPMTQTMTEIISYIRNKIDKGQVCEACKDKTACGRCGFQTKE